MRFIHKPKPELSLNLTRTYRRFLWLPLTIGNETRWLEGALVREDTHSVTRWYHGTCIPYRKTEWGPVAFVSA